MPSVLPSQEALSNAFAPRIPPASPSKEQAEPALAKKQRPLFAAWSVVDDVKHAAEKVEKEAAKDFNKASAKVQAKTGHIEPWSARYYAACTVGGMMACVSVTAVVLFFLYIRSSILHIFSIGWGEH